MKNISGGDIGKNIESSTNFLKKLSDYIENKLYDSEGNIKNGGVKSLSLTFALLVGFSMAIIVFSSIFITSIIMNKNSTIEEKDKSIKHLDKKIVSLEKEAKYWEKRYSNVYSQCDSIGYHRAKEALEFSRSLGMVMEMEKAKAEKTAESTKKELENIKTYNKELNNLKQKQ